MKNFKKAYGNLAINPNKKLFYYYLKSKPKPSLKSGNNTITDNAGMASMTILGSVFTREDTSNVSAVVPLYSASSVENILFTAYDVKEKIDKLKSGSSPEPDNFTAKILQVFSNILVPPLTMIYIKSILTGEVPYDWRCANNIHKLVL